MTSTRMVARNTLYLTIGLFSGRILAVFVYRKMAPILGTDGMAIANLATDVSTILLIIANYGLGTLITREVTRERTMTMPVMWAALKIRLALASLCFVGLYVYAVVSGFEQLERNALYIMGLGVFIEASAMACDAVLQAHDRVVSQMWGQIASALAYFGLAWWWLEAGHGIMGVMWANVASRVVRLAVMVPLMLRGTGPWILNPPGRALVKAAHSRGLLTLAWPIFLASTFGVLYYKIDTPLLRAMMDRQAVAVYTNGHRALDILSYLPGLFATAMFPMLLRAAKDEGGMERVSERALRYLHLLVMPVTFVSMLAAEPVTMWLVGGEEGFADSVRVFRVVVWGIPFIAATGVLNRMLYTAGRERSFVVIAFVSLSFNLAVNVLAIPVYGYMGASVAVVASQAVSTLMHWYYIRRAGLRLPIMRSMFTATVALLLTWLCASGLAQLLRPGWGTSWLALPLDAGAGPTFAVIGLAVLLYIPAVVLTRALTKADLPVMMSLLKRG